MPDAQAGHEKTLTALLPALAGANIIYGLGMLEMGITWSHALLVMDAEFASMIKRVVQGIPVTDDTLAVEVIRKVGAFGDFVSHEHTRRHMRSLQSAPKLIDRRPRESWLELGGTDIHHRAAEEAKRILATHQAEPMVPGAEAALREIVAEAEKALAPAARRRRERKG